MIRKKYLIIVLLFLLCIYVLFFGQSPMFQPRKNLERNGNTKDLEEKLKEEKNASIDRVVAQARKENKKYMDSDEGIAPKSDIENAPKFQEKDYEKGFKVVEKYLFETYGDNEKYFDVNLDPRIDKIYDDEDKGYCKGYSSENIMIFEFEKEKDDFEFIFLGRKDTKSAWQVVHVGKSYK